MRIAARAPLGADPPEALGTAEAWTTVVDSFLGAIEHNPTRWLSSVNAGGPEHDDEIVAILDEAGEILADQTLVAIGLESGPASRPCTLRAGVGRVRPGVDRGMGRSRPHRSRAGAAHDARHVPLLVEHVLPLIDER